MAIISYSFDLLEEQSDQGLQVILYLYEAFCHGEVLCWNFGVFTANFYGVRKFRKFTVTMNLFHDGVYIPVLNVYICYSNRAIIFPAQEGLTTAADKD